VKRDTAPSWPHLGYLSRRLLEKLGFEQLRHLAGGRGRADEMQRRCSRATAELKQRFLCAALQDDGKLKPIGSARLRSSNGAEAGSYGSLSTMPKADTSSAKPRYAQ